MSPSGVALDGARVYSGAMTSGPLANGDLVEVDADHLVAAARVRAVDGARLHVALEIGAFLPWVETPVHIRRRGADGVVSAWEARILHAGASAATLEVTGRPRPA